MEPSRCAPLLPPVRYYMLDDEDVEENPSRPTSPGGAPRPPCQDLQLPPPMSPRTWKAAAAAAALQPEPPLCYADCEPGPPPIPEPDPAAREQRAARQTESAAEDALRHYNADPSNEVKYELTRATSSAGMFNEKGLYFHVNFFARPKREDGSSSSSLAEERFFFAEVHQQRGRGARVRIPTCLCSLDGEEDDQVGGLGCNRFAQANPWLVPVDYCLTCGDGMKHPKDGASYQAGHLYALPQRKPGVD